MKFIDDERNVFVTAESFESLERQAISEFAYIVGVEKDRVRLVDCGATYLLKVIQRDKNDDERSQRMLLTFRY